MQQTPMRVIKSTKLVIPANLQREGLDACFEDVGCKNGHHQPIPHQRADDVNDQQLQEQYIDSIFR